VTSAGHEGPIVTMPAGGAEPGADAAVDLSAVAGIAVTLRDSRLSFHEPVTPPRVSIRHRSDLSQVWRAPVDHRPAGPDPELYTAYWGVVRESDAAALRARGLDHVYVVIRPGVQGDEYFKTQGHYHPPAAGSTLGAPELYQVLAGRGLFLLQHARPPYDVVDDVQLVVAQAGDVIVVPPDYGHLTANLGPDPLVFEAFLPAVLDPETAPYRARRGGAYYCVAAGGGPQYLANERYVPLPEARRTAPLHWPVPPSVAPADPPAGAASGLPAGGAPPLYRSVASRLDDFTWLSDPDRFDLASVNALLR
jgi:oxalate decarboxylase/phosphoglucose isomerase-like protein (cupin superfamily)